MFPQAASDIASLLFDSRQDADYDFDADITQEEAGNLIAQSKILLQLTIGYVNS